jgi:RNA 2',3'-cyclic 3'-phosphodiesterase
VESRAPSRPPSARLFVALDLPEEARSALVEWQGDVFAPYGRTVRLVRPASLHVTLVFLGHHPEDSVDAIRQAAFSGLSGLRAPALSAREVRAVPPRRPRLWALDLDDPDGLSTAVHEAVAAPLVEGGWYEREKRPFWPHVTVARVRAREKPPMLSLDPPPLSLVASEVVLYRSRLSRAGADYEPLARATLVT